MRYEKCRWAYQDELEDFYCCCDSAENCGACISTSNECDKCEDFYSVIEEENLFRGNGELI